MKKYFWTLLFLTTLVQSAYSCSSFVLKNGKTILLGKNFDWTFDQGYVIKNLKNTTKVAYCTHNGVPARWTSKYGSITFNQNGKEMPYGGMNEKGLVVEMLWLEDTRFNISEDKTYLNELEWVQYQLDNFQTVDEVVAHIENLKIYPIKGKIHYILADTHGKSVIIEYLEGRPEVYEKEANSCQAITNKSVVYSKKYIENIEGIRKNNTSTTYRYHKLEKQIKALQAPGDFSEMSAFQMLKSVNIPKGDFKTVWTIVYNIESRAISFFSHSHRKTKQINLNNIDFEQELSYFNINQDAEIVLDTKLKPFAEQANFEIASASLMHLGFDRDLTKEMSEHQFKQKLTTQSYFSQNYFHFNISIPMLEAERRLMFVVMDSEDNFRKRVAVTGGYLLGTTSIGTTNRHIYGLKNGTYSMIALIDENKNSELDFDIDGNSIERYATFSDFKPKSMGEITFKNTSNYFTKDNSKLTIEWR
ncbi:MAG: linear amide C-N hydrolase [Cyclobacteriaceae bacterium]|nr:linear amide C-N hydrolase [Cyclobacteriaceae bacterium]MBX2956612.1 linear amide C-N hydrolase [Cyclobacteriaceae bacterium]